MEDWSVHTSDVTHSCTHYIALAFYKITLHCMRSIDCNVYILRHLLQGSQLSLIPPHYLSVRSQVRFTLCPTPADSVQGMSTRCRHLNHDSIFTRSCVSYDSEGVAVLPRGRSLYKVCCMHMPFMWYILTDAPSGLLHGEWCVEICVVCQCVVHVCWGGCGSSCLRIYRGMT